MGKFLDKLGLTELWTACKEHFSSRFTIGKGLELTKDNVLNVTLDTTIFKVVESLPERPADGDENKIHLVSSAFIEGPSIGGDLPSLTAIGTPNSYNEYLWVDNKWELIGTVDGDNIDLSNYPTFDDVATSNKNGVLSKELWRRLTYKKVCEIAGPTYTDKKIEFVKDQMDYGTDSNYEQVFISIDSATPTTAGVMSASDKIKVDSIDKKQDKLTAGKGISIDDNVIKCTLDTTPFIVVDSLPDTPASGNENKLHLVPTSVSAFADKEGDFVNNEFDEYLFVNGKWEELGKVQLDIDVDSFAKKDDVGFVYDPNSSNILRQLGDFNWLKPTFTNDFGCALGLKGSIGGYAATTTGEDCEADGDDSFAGGNNTFAGGNCSFAFGSGALAEGVCSCALGKSVEAINASETSFGHYNNSSLGNSKEFKGDSKAMLFSVGNGTATKRHNAFEIKQNGEVSIPDVNAEGEYYNKPMLNLQETLGKCIKTDATYHEVFEKWIKYAYNNYFGYPLYSLIVKSGSELKFTQTVLDKTGSELKIFDANIPTATSTTNGLMSYDDKTKLDNTTPIKYLPLTYNANTGAATIARAISGLDCVGSLEELQEVLTEVTKGKIDLKILYGASSSNIYIISLLYTRIYKNPTSTVFYISYITGNEKYDVIFNATEGTLTYTTQSLFASEWYGTQSEYDDLGTYDDNTKYYIYEEPLAATLENKEMTKIEVSNVNANLEGTDNIDISPSDDSLIVK